MTKSLFLMVVAATAIGILSIPAQAMDTREFEAVSRDQGSVSVTMGKFDFCALTAVTAGGFNSTCIVQKQGENWVLTAVDPGKPDAYVGESQGCRATCFSMTGAPVATSPAAGQARYLGCFKDTGTRDLSGYTTNTPGMTTQLCVDTCRQKGFAYAATQFGQHCFCGNSYGKYGQATNCNMKCAGNAGETCGGSWANSVYSIK